MYALSSRICFLVLWGLRLKMSRWDGGFFFAYGSVLDVIYHVHVWCFGAGYPEKVTCINIYSR